MARRSRGCGLCAQGSFLPASGATCEATVNLAVTRRVSGGSGGYETAPAFDASAPSLVRLLVYPESALIEVGVGREEDDFMVVDAVDHEGARTLLWLGAIYGSLIAFAEDFLIERSVQLVPLAVGFLSLSMVG
jgi:hypothetical protein